MEVHGRVQAFVPPAVPAARGDRASRRGFAFAPGACLVISVGANRNSSRPGKRRSVHSKGANTSNVLQPSTLVGRSNWTPAARFFFSGEGSLAALVAAAAAASRQSDAQEAFFINAIFGWLSRQREPVDIEKRDRTPLEVVFELMKSAVFTPVDSIFSFVRSLGSDNGYSQASPYYDSKTSSRVYYAWEQKVRTQTTEGFSTEERAMNFEFRRKKRVDEEAEAAAAAARAAQEEEDERRRAESSAWSQWNAARSSATGPEAAPSWFKPPSASNNVEDRETYRKWAGWIKQQAQQAAAQQEAFRAAAQHAQRNWNDHMSANWASYYERKMREPAEDGSSGRTGFSEENAWNAYKAQWGKDQERWAERQAYKANYYSSSSSSSSGSWSYQQYGYQDYGRTNWGARSSNRAGWEEEKGEDGFGFYARNAEFQHMDLYSILEVQNGSMASAADIKEAYRRQVRKWHPDVAEDRERARTFIVEINFAYEILSDPAKKSLYDKHGSSVFSRR
eukprot:tig00001336_g8240.t1